MKVKSFNGADYFHNILIIKQLKLNDILLNNLCIFRKRFTCLFKN